MKCRRCFGAVFTLALLVSLFSEASAQPEPTRTPEETIGVPEASRQKALSHGFGPVIVIERIEIDGNSSTADHLILRALPIRAGEALRAGSPRLAAARYKVLALGFFRDVELSFAKGSRRGYVVLVVTVVERGTVVLNRMFFGTSLVTPWWAGLDIGERNFLGSGYAVGAAAVFAGEGRADGARSQRALQLRVADATFLQSRVGWFATGSYVHASEPYRVSGDPSDGSATNFRAFDYRRVGALGGVSLRLNGLSQLKIAGRFERVDADLPDAPVRVMPDGQVRNVQLHLRPGASTVATASVAYDRDTRSDPVLTWAGDRLMLYGEFGASWIGSSYDYGIALGRYQRWWPLGTRKHVLSAHLAGGIVLGKAPRFDRLHVGDLNRMVSPRALGLVVAATPSLDLLGTSTDEVNYGEVGGIAEVQYAYRLFRSSRFVYGGDLFAGVGLWVLANTRNLKVRDESLYRALPVDLLVDAGLRLDTEIGIFELSLANGLGRLPI
jgi:hypothetical protein